MVPSAVPYGALTRGLGVDAHQARADRRGEVVPEARMRDADAAHRSPDALGDDQARALRAGACAARPAPKSQGAGECPVEGVDLLVGSCQPPEVMAALGLGPLLAQLGEATPVLRACLRVQDRAEIAIAAGTLVSTGNEEVQGVELAVRVTQQRRQVLETLGIADAADVALECQRPVVPLAADRPTGSALRRRDRRRGVEQRLDTAHDRVEAELAGAGERLLQS